MDDCRLKFCLKHVNKNDEKNLTSVPADPILESSRTTYFDISQETGTESGEPPGELKITTRT
jgi:hypothetical protein